MQVKVWAHERTNVHSFTGKDGVCTMKTIAGLDFQHETTPEFFLSVGDKTYRFHVDKEGNITLLLINGTDMRVTTVSGMPAIVLTKQ